MMIKRRFLCQSNRYTEVIEEIRMVKKRIEAGVAQLRVVQFSGANLVTRNEVSETTPEACRAKLRGAKQELINGSMIPKEKIYYYRTDPSIQ